MRRIRIAFLAGDGGDVDDAAVILFDHRGHDRLATDERPVEIDAQHLAPFLEVGLPHRLVDAGDAGIVDENVDLGAVSYKTFSDRPPKTLRAAGDDGAAAVEIDLVHGEVLSLVILMVRSALLARVSNHEARGPSFETRPVAKFTQATETCLRGRSSG